MGLVQIKFPFYPVIERKIGAIPIIAPNSPNPLYCHPTSGAPRSDYFDKSFIFKLIH